MVMFISQDKAICRVRDQGTVDFDVFDQKERSLFHLLEERPKRGLTCSSCSESSHSSLLQEQLFQHFISTDRLIGRFAQMVVSTSRNDPCVSRQRQRPTFDSVFLRTRLNTSGERKPCRNVTAECDGVRRRPRKRERDRETCRLGQKRSEFGPNPEHSSLCWDIPCDFKEATDLIGW